jgi:tRNA threonylcarbamoyladenosine biosynthesis protein TsaE
MGESELTRDFHSEADLIDFAGLFARRLMAAGCAPLVVGLTGPLGSGKTTWVRAMLRGLGHAGRVPSPTYTLLEQYDVAGLLLVHLDLYRLSGDAELENLGLRDWLAGPHVWLVAEWPERAPAFGRRCDLMLEFGDLGAASRRVTFKALTSAGITALERCYQPCFNKDP